MTETMDFKKIKTSILIDSLPQNRPLYKDSGLWQIRSDDMEEVLFQQTSDETFENFIIRCCQALKNDEIFMMDLASKLA